MSADGSVQRIMENEVRDRVTIVLGAVPSSGQPGLSNSLVVTVWKYQILSALTTGLSQLLNMINSYDKVAWTHNSWTLLFILSNVRSHWLEDQILIFWGLKENSVFNKTLIQLLCSTLPADQKTKKSR